HTPPPAAALNPVIVRRPIPAATPAFAPSPSSCAVRFPGRTGEIRYRVPFDRDSTTIIVIVFC
ncbi:MAG TPA: hypothetical protein VI365_34445, partial [Trebonia sp.]